MSETRFPPPRPPAAGSSSGGGGDRPALQNVLVTAAPASVTEGSRNKTLLLDGRISGYNTQRGETTITTAKGDIVIQTGNNSLPVGTDVSVELRMQGLSLRANIAVIRAKNAEAKAAQETIRPPAAPPVSTEPPPLKSGDRLMALRLPAETPPPATTQTGDAPDTAPARPTLEQAARIIEAARAAVGISRLAMMLPPLPSVPLPVVWQVLNTRDIMTALVRLPENMQAQLQDFLARPDVTGALRQVLPPAQANTLLPPLPAGADAEALAQVQMALRAAPAPASTSTPPLAGGSLMGLMPLLGSMMPAAGSAASMMMMAGKLPNMAPGAQNLPLPQNMAQLTIHDVVPQRTPLPMARPVGSIVAVVEALTASGAPILKTPDAHFVLRQNIPLPVGTQLILSMQPAQAADILAENPFAMRSLTPLDPLFSRGWPALDEALALLNASAAQAAQAMAQTIPAASARLAPTTLFFLAALRMGSIESWLGAPAMDALRGGGRKDLAERLAQDFGRLASLSKNIVAGEWRAISMPLLQQDQHISLIQFFLRQPPPDEDEVAGSGDPQRKMTRFILNLHLSRMGDMQFDGLLHKKRFDLILRSEEKLPAVLRQELMQRFAAGLDQTGMEGGLSFQTRAEHWMQIPETSETGVQA
ncbi:MAG: hypothetical protein Q8K65_01255 [Alphaproteobacteria bacterium]|nr:hypothetical protein [Alphaproteobacteria bacterium]